jgi:hypothetical protein
MNIDAKIINEIVSNGRQINVRMIKHYNQGVFISGIQVLIFDNQCKTTD